ncbi:MAG TPA: hypothetical protein VFJ66_06830 [Gaiellales bacterium]|nr:hypothetical protein [Gaiellales bacterium]
MTDRRTINQRVRLRDVDGSWITFAITMLSMVGLFNVIEGIVALQNSKFFAGNAEYAIGNLRTWGWIELAVGILQILTAVGLVYGNQAARWVGVILAGLNGIAQLLSVQAYPLWSIAAFALDILVIYALTAYGDPDELERG